MKLWAVMRRDLRKYMRNPMTVATSILMPIVYLLIIGNSFQGQLKNLPVAVVTQDRGEYARRLLERLQALAAGPKTITITYLNDPRVAVDAVRDGKYKGAVIIPPDFSRDVIDGRVGEVGLFTDNVDLISSSTLNAVLNDAVGSLRTDFVTARQLKLNALVLRPTQLFP
jgi:ABC-2 type transport system permease protein